MKKIQNIFNKLINESLSERAEELTQKIKEKVETNEDLGVDELNFDDEYEVDLPKGKRIMKFKHRKSPKLGASDEMGMYTFQDEKGELPMSINRLKKNVKKHMKENEMEEGNAFTGALNKAKKMGKDKFTVDGKEYNVTENFESELDEKLHGGQKKLDKNHNGKIDSEDFKMLRKSKKSEIEELGGMEDSHPRFGKMNLMNPSDEDKETLEKFLRRSIRKHRNDDEEDFGTMRSRFFDKEDEESEFDNLAEGDKKFIQKATKKMEKKGTSGKFGAWCKKEGLDKDGEVTQKCINKAMKSDDSKVVKMANFAKNIGGFKGAKHESIEYRVSIGDNDYVNLTENELIDMIEELVVEEQGKSKGLVQYDKVHKVDGKENRDAMKKVAKKMRGYSKSFNENPDYFPKTSGEIEEMDKKAYIPSDAVDEYIDAFAYPGMTNLNFDEIKPNDELIAKYLKGDKTTGNSSEYANAVKTEVGEKFYKNYENNLYGAEQKNASYKRQVQPVDEAGEGKTSGSLKSIKNPTKKSQKIFDKLGESIETENTNLISEDMKKMKMLISYNKKTQ